MDFSLFVQNGIYILVALAIMVGLHYMAEFVGKVDGKTPSSAIKDGVTAVGIQRTGMYLALAIGLCGYISSGQKMDYMDSLQTLVIDGVLLGAMLLIASVIADKLIVVNHCNRTAIYKDNRSIGFVEAGTFIATGFIAWGSFTGEGNLLSAIVFFALGQLVLVSVAWLYEKITPFVIQDMIKANNVSAGILLASVIISQGLILRNAVSGDFIGWGTDIASFFVYAIVGFIILSIVTFGAEKVIFRKNSLTKSLEDGNVALILKFASVRIAVATIISASL